MKVTLVGTVDSQLEELLRSMGAQVTAGDAATLAELANSSAPQPDVIVVDLRGGTALLQAVAPVRRQHHNTGVIAVVGSLDPQLLLDALRLEISDILAAPVSQADLGRAISRVLGDRSSGEGGQVFAFVGAKGGVGTTTLAVNVTMALGAICSGEKSLLMDLHQCGGDAAVFVGVEPKFSIIDALQNTHRLDLTFIRSLVAKAGPGFDLLASSERMIDYTFGLAEVRSVIDCAARTYKHTVVDLSRDDATGLCALDRVNMILIVVNQELATIKNASRMADAFRRRYSPERVSFVLNRSDRQAEITLADVERAVGGTISHVFPNDYRLALQALNKGRPVALDHHNALAGSFTKFARHLVGKKADHAVKKADPKKKAEESRVGLLSRLSFAGRG